MITIKEIKENIKCPQFGDANYGKWGALKIEQKITYKQLIEVIESADEVIKKQIKEKERLNNIINKAIEYIENIEDLKLKWVSDSIVDIVGYKKIEDLDNKYHNLEGCFIEINKHYLLDILKGDDKE